jgi:hypothetical protein
MNNKTTISRIRPHSHLGTFSPLNVGLLFSRRIISSCEQYFQCARDRTLCSTLEAVRGIGGRRTGVPHMLAIAVALLGPATEFLPVPLGTVTPNTQVAADLIALLLGPAVPGVDQIGSGITSTAAE